MTALRALLILLRRYQFPPRASRAATESQNINYQCNRIDKGGDESMNGFFSCALLCFILINNPTHQIPWARRRLNAAFAPRISHHANTSKLNLEADSSSNVTPNVPSVHPHVFIRLVSPRKPVFRGAFPTLRGGASLSGVAGWLRFT
jgi:hypothetical protein